MLLRLRILVRTTKANPAFLRSRCGWSHQLANRVEHAFELPVVFPFEVIEPFGQILVRGQPLPQPHERPHDLDVDRNGSLAVQHAGKHGDAVW